MVGSEARLVGRKKARVFKIGKELERDQTFIINLAAVKGSGHKFSFSKWAIPRNCLMNHIICLIIMLLKAVICNVLHVAFLPPLIARTHNLRARSHPFQLPAKDDRNYTSRVL